MNRSYSKIRHIQESNHRLENRLLNEMNTDIDTSRFKSLLESTLGDVKPLVNEQAETKVVGPIGVDPIKLGFSESGNGYILKLLQDDINIKIINKINDDKFLVHVYVKNVSEETIKNLQAFTDVSLILKTPFKAEEKYKYVSSSGEINGVDLEKIVNLLKPLPTDYLK